uniref:Innexin n=1 Tax=Setaria digitata TaxID=48799 RepID=A0A915PKI7_9BILA
MSLLQNSLSITNHINHLDDMVDRLHRNFTVFTLIFCAMLVGAKQQFGQPIQCMLPAHLHRPYWNNYGQYYCFVQSTYRLTYNKTLPNANSRTKLRASNSWVPVFLTFQALCFYIPGWLWITVQSQGTLDMKAVVSEAISLKATIKPEDRVKKLTNLVHYVASMLKLTMTTNVHRTKWYWCPLDSVNGISVALYLVSKLLIILNNVVQLYITETFIGFNRLFWIPTKISFMSTYFPIITFCDLERQFSGTVETNTLQCVLILNFINEKIFFILWYWISLLFVVSLANFITTFVQCVLPRYRKDLVEFYLQNGELNDEEWFSLKDEKRLSVYVKEFLGLDGVLLLRFINDHAGAIVTRDIAVSLWHAFCQENSSFLICHRTAPKVEESEIMNTYSAVRSPTVSLNRS